MEVVGKQYISYPSRSDIIRIWNLSDLHIGNKACAMDQIQRDIGIIRDDPCAFFVGGGDYADFIGYTDKRFDPDCVAENIQVKELGKLGHVLMARVRDLLLPIKHKCLGLLFGNHELKYMRDKEQADLHAWMCTELGVLNLGYSAFLDVVFVRDPKKPIALFRQNESKRELNRTAFRIYVHHGAGFANTPAGKLKKLIDFMFNFDADIYFVGHVHDQSGKRIVSIGADADCKKLVQKERLGVISGSYLKTYAQNTTTYGEQRGYSPTVLGSAIVEIEPDKRRISGSI